MSVADLQSKDASSPTSDSDQISRSTSDTLDQRKSEELFLGFAGPIGCGIKLVVAEVEAALRSIGYEVYVIKLSKLIQGCIDKKEIIVDSSTYDAHSDNVRRIMGLQDGGNKLREFDTSRLAEFAIKEIVICRGQESKKDNYTGSVEEYVPKKTAYLIDQIKHPDEVALLRIVYRQLFHLVGVISVAEKRRGRLMTGDKVKAHEISELMERDRRQEDENGQQLDRALQMADFFVSTDRGTTTPLQNKIKRFLGLLHGENGITPTSQEYGMYAAYSAGLRSACLSRQVGAAIADRSGKIVSTGCNDVPKALGGLYSVEDNARDHRCVHKEEQICFNDREKNSHKADIEVALKNLKKSGTEERLILEDQIPKILDAVYKASHIPDLTEFSRAVHAEMEAIISLARTGTPGIVGATLYTTTFPCHSCARHIVAAGISRVYYIEPYEKSLAKKLHADAIAFEIEDDAELERRDLDNLTQQVVHFVHFEGVAPKQYLNFFKMTKRKEMSTGRVIKIAPKNAPKVVSEYLDNYRDFEAKVVDKLTLTAPKSLQQVGEMKEGEQKE